MSPEAEGQAEKDPGGSQNRGLTELSPRKEDSHDLFGVNAQEHGGRHEGNEKEGQQPDQPCAGPPPRPGGRTPQGRRIPTVRQGGRCPSRKRSERKSSAATESVLMREATTRSNARAPCNTTGSSSSGAHDAEELGKHTACFLAQPCRRPHDESRGDHPTEGHHEVEDGEDVKSPGQKDRVPEPDGCADSGKQPHVLYDGAYRPPPRTSRGPSPDRKRGWPGSTTGRRGP